MGPQTRFSAAVWLVGIAGVVVALGSGCAESECSRDADCGAGQTCVRTGVIFGGGICAGGVVDAGTDSSSPTDTGADVGDVEGDTIAIDTADGADGGGDGVDATDATDTDGAEAGDTGPSDTADAADTSACPAERADRVPMGLFTGTPDLESEDSRWREVEDHLGREVLYGSTFLSASDWTDFDGDTAALGTWEDWGEMNRGRRFVIHVPLLPQDEPDATLQKGASGEYNDEFRKVAEDLVRHDQEDAIVRIGGAFNTPRHPYRAEDNAFAYRDFFREVVDVMRGVDDANFAFVWNPKVPGKGFDATKVWPGPDYVDYIGLDVFDHSPKYPFPDDCDAACKRRIREEAWQGIVDGSAGRGAADGQGLDFWSSFADERNLPLAITDWGAVHSIDGSEGGGDNPVFVRNMARFIRDPAHNVKFHVVFDSEYNGISHRVATEVVMPEASEVFHQFFGDGSCP